ncbi:MAG TPA: SHOCT domain-containing protein [Gallionella sp.]|nr:SHOCT domain-containing protein [Gallionella sp.]
MVEYILVVAFFTGPLAGTNGVSISSLPVSFASAEECEQAGATIKEKFGDNAKYASFICLKHTKTKDIQPNESGDKQTGDMYSDLKKLKELLDSKIITQAEFNAQKKIIIDKYK